MLKLSALLFFIIVLASACNPVTPLTLNNAVPTSTPETTPDPTTVPTPRLFAQQNATPFVFPSRTVPISVCDSAPPTYLIVHERARVTNEDPKPLNVRESPGLDGRRVGQLERLDIFVVIDGPRCADEYTWFKVRAGGIEGWVAEGDDQQYYIVPYT